MCERVGAVVSGEYLLVEGTDATQHPVPFASGAAGFAPPREGSLCGRVPTAGILP